MADAMKLVPCAFCGADPSVSKYEVDDETSKWAAGCNGDGAPESWVFVEHYVSVHAATKAEVVAAWNRRASPPAREEAPADPYGPLDNSKLFLPEAPAEGAGELWPVGSWLSAALDDPKVCDAMKADIREWFNNGGHLRNRTSEPEAGAVAWLTPGGDVTRSHAYAVEQSANDPDHYPQALYLYPDPATADKLRVAVEALEPFAAASLDRESQNAKTLPGGASVRVTLAQCRKARQALAALNEGGE